MYLKINTWLTAPYKKPEHDIPENTVYNNHVSIVRIQSEHSIGFLKGHFPSLKGLHINIRDENSHKLATYWTAACICIHSFAMQCEDDEDPNRDTMNVGTHDPFINEGLSSSSESDQNSPTIAGRQTTTCLQRAKAF